MPWTPSWRGERNPLSMASYSLIVLRVIAGFGLAALFGFAVLIVARVLFRLVIVDLIFGGYMWAGDVYVVMLFSGIGTAAGTGVALGWLGSDIAPKLSSPRALAWQFLGLAASWAAYAYKTRIDPYASYENNEVTATAVLWAVLAPGIVATAIGVYRYVRDGPT